MTTDFPTALLADSLRWNCVDDRTKSGMLSLLIIKHPDVLEAYCFHGVA